MAMPLSDSVAVAREPDITGSEASSERVAVTLIDQSEIDFICTVN